MNEMLNYIFNTLRSTETKTNILSRTIKQQKYFNRNTTVFMCAALVYMVVEDVKINRINDEIEELKTKIMESGKEKGD